MRNAFMDIVIEAAMERDDLVVVTGDAGLGVLDGLRDNRPGAFLNLGAAEQNMAGFAAGLAMTGCKVFLYNIVPFLLYRCYEQVRNDVCGQNLPVVLVGVGSGVTYAPAGMSHYAVEDIGVAATLPELTVFSPCDVHEARAAALFSLSSAGPVYVRIAKRGGDPIHSGPLRDISAPIPVREGSDCALLFHGSIGAEAADAAERMEKAGISTRLVSVPALQPLDESALLDTLSGVRLVVTLEEHCDATGLGNMVARVKALRGPSWALRTRGFPSMHLTGVNDTAGMRRRFGLTGEQVARDAERWLADGS